MSIDCVRWRRCWALPNQRAIATEADSTGCLPNVVLILSLNCPIGSRREIRLNGGIPPIP